MVIMVALMALVMPAFSNMATGSAVNGASRMVSAQLMLSRQYAIANRCRVAVIMPRDENASFLDQYRYTSMRPAIVTGGLSPFAFSRWVENTDWAFLPNGASIMEADADVGVGPGGTYDETPTENGMVRVSFPYVAGSVEPLKALGCLATVNNVRAVVFHPTGRVEGGSNAFVTVVERLCVGGTWLPPKDPGPNATPTESGKNQLTLVVNRFTGRVETKTPEKY